MTVIAYREGWIAGDSCWFDGEAGLIETSQTKVLRLKSGGLYGGAGACDDRELIAKLNSVRTAEKLPSVAWLSRPSLEGLTALVVLPDCTVWQIDCADEASITPRTGAYAAIGTGAAVAIGAMWFGADAYKAVEAACVHNVYCRTPITTLPLL